MPAYNFSTIRKRALRALGLTVVSDNSGRMGRFDINRRDALCPQVQDGSFGGQRQS
jgi:hypothetical protein